MLFLIAAALTADAPVEIIVRGRSDREIGRAVTASEGSVSGAELSCRPLLRPGELLEAVPGLMATQHSGGGKANQYFLRGFDLDHGTDFSVTIDGMPMNLPSHGHGQGYLDVNGLIPEAVERVDYRKGPYRADAGDFSFVGQARLITRNTLAPELIAEAGPDDYRRMVLGGSAPAAAGDLLALVQDKTQNGPWTLAEHFHSLSALVKYSRVLPVGRLSVSFSAYDARWRPTDQIPERALGARLSSPFDTLDPWLRGATSRQILTANLTGASWTLSAWAQHYDFSLISNATYYLDDPVNGDEIRQFDHRTSIGGRAETSWATNGILSFTWGVEARLDDLPSVGLYHTTHGTDRELADRFGITEAALSAYGEARLTPLPRVEITAGLRGDGYDFRTTAKGGDAWDGRRRSALASPRLSLSYAPVRDAAVYAGWGQGFHSNDARGVTNPADPQPGLVKGTFEEIGGRYEPGSLRLAAVLWRSHIDSELVYNPDDGTVEPDGAARRTGYELTAFWKPWPGFDLDAVYARNDGALDGEAAGNNAIPGAVRRTGEIGATVKGDRWNAGLRLRYLGPRVLTQDDAHIAKSTTLVNLRAAWQATRRFELYAEVLNLTDRPAHDMDYYYATRLPGEPSAGVEDETFHMAEPREVRVGLKTAL
jgi:hypothetical protein